MGVGRDWRVGRGVERSFVRMSYCPRVDGELISDIVILSLLSVQFHVLSVVNKTVKELRCNASMASMQ